MENDKIVTAMREFVVQTVASNDKATSRELERAVEDYFNNSFCMSDHLDTWDIRDSVRNYMDENFSDIVRDELSGHAVEEAVDEYLNNNSVVMDTINDMEFDGIIIDYLESEAGKCLLADVILSKVFPKINEVNNAGKL